MRVFRFALIICVASIVTASFGLNVQAVPSRTTMSLDGDWNFATDPKNVGEAEKWFLPEAKLPAMPLPGYAPEANGKIQVPGIWDNQGYGTETQKTRHNFAGKGWYKRTIEIPKTWENQNRYLIITGVNRYSKVWVDDHYLGEHVGYLSTQEYDITPFATPGKSVTITIQVDSKQRWEIDALFGASSLADYMDIEWGGIWGHVLLETRSDAWLSDLYLQPNLSNSSCSAKATLNGKKDFADTVKLDILDKDGNRVAENLLKIDPTIVAGESVTLEAIIPDVKLWTPDSPTLYTARLSLVKVDQIIDTQESRFGMRQFTVDGPHLLLNGKRVMLRGYGDDHIYPEQMAMPCDKELHLKRLHTIKSYGFNHVRHHSTIMPPEYYDACDEVGIICTAEFPICYSHFLPGTGDFWKKRVPEGTSPEAATETYKREWAAAIKRHRNHPSILCWVMGNELWDGIPLRVGFQQIARQLDPGRFFADTDGLWKRFLDQPKDRDTLGIYFLMFDVFANPLDLPKKFETQEPLKPIIAHEAGNYVTFSRPDLAEQFQDNIKPFWLTAGCEKLKQLGLWDEAKLWSEKSEQLYLLLHKYNIETLRKNPYLSGYHWWLFQDYWTSSNGLVDHYFRPKSILPAEVQKINSDVVLLQDGLERTYRAKEKLDIKLLVSNFSENPLQGEFEWKVKIGDQTVRGKKTSSDPVTQGSVSEAVRLNVELPDVSVPTMVNIVAKLTVGEPSFTNDWTAWVYPNEIRPRKSDVSVLADAAQMKQCKDWDVKPIPAKGPLDSRAVYATSWPITPRTVDALEQGAGVILLNGINQLFKSNVTTFRTSWWKAGDAPDRNQTGTFVYDHPATRDMAPEDWCDIGWFHLLQGGKKYDIESAPVSPKMIIRALPSMALVKNETLLFEVGVGKGTLIVSGLNHQDAMDRPENQWLIARLIDHAARLTPPKEQWPASFLTSIPSVVPEGCLAGFREVIANEGEESTWHSFREDNTRVLVCRQSKPGNRVTWETASVPEGLENKSVTFVFAGGLGFASEPKTEGFVLELDGKEILRFDLPEPKSWQSTDQRVTLRFNSLRTVSVDQFGLFHLTIPYEMLTPGKPCVLSVRSLGSESKRWFGLNPYW